MWKIPISIIKTQIVIMISISFFHICVTLLLFVISAKDGRIVYVSFGMVFKKTHNCGEKEVIHNKVIVNGTLMAVIEIFK